MNRTGLQWMGAWAISAVFHFAALAAVGRWLQRKEPVRIIPGREAVTLTAIEFESAPSSEDFHSPEEPPENPELPPEPVLSLPPQPMESEEDKRSSEIEIPKHELEAITSDPSIDDSLTEPLREDSAFESVSENPAPDQTLNASQPASVEDETASDLAQKTDKTDGPETPTILPPVSPATTGPTLLTAIRPRYPLGSRLRGEEGLVVVRAWVTPAGTVRSAEIAVSSRFPALDEAARRAVLSARFKPYEESGTEPRAEVEIRIRFVLKE